MAQPIDFFALEAHILDRLKTLDTDGSLVFKTSIDASGMTRQAISAQPTFVVAHLESQRLKAIAGATQYQQRYAVHLLMRGASKERKNDGVLLLKAMQLFMGRWSPDIQVWSPLEAGEEGVVSEYNDNVREHLF